MVCSVAQTACVNEVQWGSKPFGSRHMPQLPTATLLPMFRTRQSGVANPTARATSERWWATSTARCCTAASTGAWGLVPPAASPSGNPQRQAVQGKTWTLSTSNSTLSTPFPKPPFPLLLRNRYPGDKKNPNGKLRLLYECAPMSFIAEQAGGKGSTGTERVMDIVPTGVHQRVPLFIGSPGEVDYLESFYKKE